MDRDTDIVGMRFGKLTVLAFDHAGKYRTYYRCKCDCGKEAIVARMHLTSGKTKSCGCLRADSLAIVRGQFQKRVHLNEQQVAWLVKHYKHTRNADIQAKLGLSEGSLHRMARKLGLSKSPQFIRKTQEAAAKKAYESHKRNGTFPPKGYIIPYSQEHWFKVGDPRRHWSAKREKERIEKAAATLRSIRESEVVRIKYGLPQLTKMRLCGDSARVHKWRHYLVKQRGYILGSDRYTFYYDENTRRSPKLEAGGNPFTFEPLKKEAI